jgi:hypothetical protein
MGRVSNFFMNYLVHFFIIIIDFLVMFDHLFYLI